MSLRHQTTLYDCGRDCSAAMIGNKLHVASKMFPTTRNSHQLKKLPSTFSSLGVGIFIYKLILNVQVRINHLCYYRFHLGSRRRRRRAVSPYDKSKLERNITTNVSIKIKEKYLRLNYLSSSFSFSGVSGIFATLSKSERSFF